MLIIIVLFAGIIVDKKKFFCINFLILRKPFPRELIDKPNVLAFELRDDESILSTNSTLRHVW